MNQAKKRMWIWIAVGVAVALAILSIFCVEYYMDNKETIGFHKENENRVRFMYEAEDEYIYWMIIDFETDTSEKVGKHRKIQHVEVDFFDPNRDHRNG